jgi:succinoglycan biosynthesis protein ExoA
MNSQENRVAPIRVSIVVACCNEIQHVREFLDSVLAQDLQGLGWEAIIADGLSKDGTRAVLAEYCAKHPQLRFIDNPELIVSTGLNAAIRGARGKIIIRMDAHTRYAPDYCLLCLATLESTGADNVGGPARTIATGIRARAVAAAYHSRFCTGARFHDVNYEGWVDTVTYGCWRKSTFDRIGLFDEHLVRNQDDEFNLRLVRAGGKIWQNPRIMSWYSPRTKLSSVFRQYFQYGFWKVAVIRKHKMPGSWRHAVPVLFVVTNLALLATIPSAASAGSAQLALWSAVLWTAMIACYGVANLTASVVAAHSTGWDLFPYLPAAFATYHSGWGLGFLVGVFKILKPVDSANLVIDSAYSRLSR